MLNRKWLGDKTKGGFYKKQKGPDGEQRLALDWKTLEYRPSSSAEVRLPLEMAKNSRRPARAPAHADRALERQGQHSSSGPCSSDLWTYAANRVPEIADSIVEIDGHEDRLQLGDGPVRAVGRRRRRQDRRAHEEGRPPGRGQRREAARLGQDHLVRRRPQAASGRKYFDIATGDYKPEEVPAGVWSVTVAKKANGVVKKNAGASLIDLGDGVGCIEFHSKMNALGGDIVSFITQTLKPGGAGDNFDAFVITNDAANFSVGANIMMLLMAVQEAGVGRS